LLPPVHPAQVGVVVRVVEALRALLPAPRDLTFGVITFYAKQRQEISLALQNQAVPEVLVNTVDGFQGGERDVIVISCVRAGGGRIGFLEEKERLNVALTRARYCLVVVGDTSTLASACPDLWGQLVGNARERGRLLTVAPGAQVEELSELLRRKER